MFAKILLPIDLTEVHLSQGSIKAATRLAKAFNGELRLVNVQSLVPVAYIDYMPADFAADITRGLETELEALAGRIDLPAGRVSTALSFGPVRQKTLEEAESWGADVIIVASHQPGADRFLIGSEAAAIVGHAHCSVLVVRG